MCKLCSFSQKAKHPSLSEVNILLEDRKNRRKDKFGRQINAKYVLARYAELGVVNPNMGNLINHLKHIGFESDPLTTARLEGQQIVEAEMRREMADLTGADVADRIIDLELRVYLAKRQAEHELGSIMAVTTDQIRSLIGEKTKRKHNDAQDELLRGLSAGVGAFVSKALGPSVLPELEPVIDAEVVEVE